MWSFLPNKHHFYYHAWGQQTYWIHFLHKTLCFLYICIVSSLAVFSTAFLLSCWSVENLKDFLSTHLLVHVHEAHHGTIFPVLKASVLRAREVSHVEMLYAYDLSRLWYYRMPVLTSLSPITPFDTRLIEKAQKSITHSRIRWDDYVIISAFSCPLSQIWMLCDDISAIHVDFTIIHLIISGYLLKNIYFKAISAKIWKKISL